MAFVSRCEIYITTTGIGSSHLLHKETCEIVCDSILENKERTKSYWEGLMLAAAVGEKGGGVGGGGGLGESVVERDIRLQREREAQVAIEREAALRTARLPPTDNLPSIDEGNFSGSEEKSTDGNTSRVTTPEGEFAHQRTPSYESMSSGHSSSSEFGTRRRPSVKPIDEPQEPDLPTYIKHQKETPIEREIRLAKEREEELKREKHFSLPLMNNLSILEKENRSNNNIVATKRIQKEIERSSEREKENSIITKTKDVSVQTKDNLKDELEAVSLKKCVSMSSIPLAVHRDATDNHITGKNAVGSPAKISGPFPTRPLLNNTTPKLFKTNLNQRGLMKRFLDSHGKMGPICTFSPTQTFSNQPSEKSHILTGAKKLAEKGQVEKQETVSPSRRPGYRSTEDKIQMELEEMKRREAELRKERAHHFGKSQPNLHQIGMKDDEEQDDDEVQFPRMGKLRTALSNPNLIEKPVPQKPQHKKRSALIDEWESRIRKEK